MAVRNPRIMALTSTTKMMFRSPPQQRAVSTQYNVWRKPRARNAAWEQFTPKKPEAGIAAGLRRFD
jgi:hypothetical protein